MLAGRSLLSSNLTDHCAARWDQLPHQGMAELPQAGQRLWGNWWIFPGLLVVQEHLEGALSITSSEGNQVGFCAEGTYFFGTYVGLRLVNLGSQMRKVKLSSSLIEKKKGGGTQLILITACQYRTQKITKTYSSILKYMLNV